MNLSSRLLLVLPFLLIAPAQAFAQTPDTLGTGRGTVTWGDAALAAGFAGAAALAAPADKWITRQFQEEGRQSNDLFRAGSAAGRFWGNPGSLIAGGTIYLLGTAQGNRRTQDLGLHSAGAIVLANVVTGGIKVIAGRARPYVDTANTTDFQPMRGLREDAYRSFPSSHATSAFAFASVVTAETSHWWPRAKWPVGVLTYGAATMAGASRIHDRHHWASDVIVGAAIGTLTGLSLFRYQHSHPDNRIDRTFLRADVQASAGPGIVIFSMNFR